MKYLLIIFLLLRVSYAQKMIMEMKLSTAEGMFSGGSNWVERHSPDVPVRCLYGPYTFKWPNGTQVIGDTVESRICVPSSSPIHWGGIGQRVFVYNDEGYAWNVFNGNDPTDIITFNNGVH